MQTKQTHVSISADLAQGLIEVLQNAAQSRDLESQQKQLAAAYADVLEKNLATRSGKRRVRLSIHVVANILRVILMILKPDPLIRAAIEFLSRIRSEERRVG